MMAGNPLAEWKACDRLRQADLDHLMAAGVPIMALAGNADGSGFCVARDRIVPHVGARRFEFARHDTTAGESVPALIVLALDARGRPLDLVATRNGGVPFVGSWLGLVGLLGEERLWRARDVLTVHPSPLDWLRASRTGVCVVDPVWATPMLRDAGPIEVGTHVERRRLSDMLTVRLPDIRVRPTERSAAA